MFADGDDGLKPPASDEEEPIEDTKSPDTKLSLNLKADLKGQVTNKKKSMYDFVPDSNSSRGSRHMEEDDKENDEESGKEVFGGSDFNKLDYTLPTTASEVFRSNFIVNKTFR